MRRPHAILAALAVTTTSVIAPSIGGGVDEAIAATTSTVIDLGADVHDVAIDETAGLAYVSVPAQDEVVTIDLTTGLEVDSDFFANPWGLELSADGSTLFVALRDSTGVAVWDLVADTTQIITVPELDDPRTYDVINPQPDLLLVSASPSSSGLAYIAAVDLTDNSTSRVASNEIIRAAPTFTGHGDFVYVGEGFSPNSLYKLDLTQPGIPIVLEDDHGAVSGTQRSVVAPDGSVIVTGAGQRLDTTNFVQTGAFGAGLGEFSVSDGAFWVYDTSFDTAGDLRRYDPITTQQLRVFPDPCGFSQPLNGSGFEDAVGRFIITAGSEVCILAVPTICFGQVVDVDLALGQTPTPGPDVILGTPGNDVIDALGGDDRICALGGFDTIDGGDGVDLIDGGDDADTIDGGGQIDGIVGGSGGDLIYGGAGSDIILAGEGNDTVLGGTGDDEIHGGPGDDELRGQNGADTVWANTDTDTGSVDEDAMYGGGGHDKITGDRGPDVILGGNHADVLAGKAGDDMIYGNNGADTLRGGPHDLGDYCNGGTRNSSTGDVASACETVLNVP
ncbi:MAG: hypothetical protein QNJ12_05715 [Ilumatobacter sp.]|uniref:hypothetical protein n=1 Tax=Ilumatobacter sp. TaxID=1967498 RepID=UPI002617AF1A|nr:hypothetical protein [Ilumatobacter sp.]MDJ0768268.1 hypothetical protein [Ilumatobacter sp.]